MRLYPFDTFSLSSSVYSVEVIDNNLEVLAKFALSPYPILHKSLDVGLIHLKDEDAALERMKNLGVEPLSLRHRKKTLADGDSVYFEGFEIKNLEDSDGDDDYDEALAEDEAEDDVRAHSPFSADGTVISPADERDLIQTTTLLTDGMCGAPVLDEHGFVAGIVEGIVPTDHENPFVAGAAATVTSPALHTFVDQSEEMMLRKIMPEDLMKKLAQARKIIQKRGGTIPNNFFEEVINSNVGGKFDKSDKKTFVKITEELAFGKDIEMKVEDLEKLVNKFSEDITDVEWEEPNLQKEEVEKER